MSFEGIPRAADHELVPGFEPVETHWVGPSLPTERTRMQDILQEIPEHDRKTAQYVFRLVHLIYQGVSHRSIAPTEEEAMRRVISVLPGRGYPSTNFTPEQFLEGISFILGERNKRIA